MLLTQSFQPVKDQQKPKVTVSKCCLVKRAKRFLADLKSRRRESGMPCTPTNNGIALSALLLFNCSHATHHYCYGELSGLYTYLSLLFTWSFFPRILFTLLFLQLIYRIVNIINHEVNRGKASERQEQQQHLSYDR
ncbi:hypothetical protein BDF20DRAFT_833014 [Mycotypha africana]|uniref:uncharacterized protein n=1 Tax=Mycotypha africana TaxID=64632 RepID=UPI0023015DCD|nr:uncharacterized protein BDF20DRAFT_833014 [Mycotypha africana]KAI8988139.1 hypothetical protein BDF20DRAFT_833014 [Mycotypha africana]